MAYRYVQNRAGSAEIFLYDPIGERWGGVSQKQIFNDLRAIGEVENITIRIDSDGGDVREGHAIYNHMKEHKARKTVMIDGWAASIASVIAMAGDEIQISENAMMMVHNPWGLVVGESDDLRREADVLDSIKDKIVRAYNGKTKLPEEQIRDLMKDTTWMDAEKSIELGFADSMNEETLLAAKSIDWKRYKYPEPPGFVLSRSNVAKYPRKKEFDVRYASVEKALTKYRL